ncbi:hypothetical protein FKM82_026042 [Ascaphus truei]
MKLGISKPWPVAMEMITGQRTMSAHALLDYFKPLTDWLIEQNAKNGDNIGWPEYNWMPAAQEAPSSKVDFLGMSLSNGQASAGQWILLVLGVALVITAIVLGVQFSKVKRKTKRSTSEMEIQ